VRLSFDRRAILLRRCTRASTLGSKILYNRVAIPVTASPCVQLHPWCNFHTPLLVLTTDPLKRKVLAMENHNHKLTAAVLSPDSSLWFSAYGFGWGYCAFELPAHVAREQLGAADAAPNQLMLAFELGRRRVLRAVEQKMLPANGERIVLSAEDL